MKERAEQTDRRTDARKQGRVAAVEEHFRKDLEALLPVQLQKFICGVTRSA